MMKRKHKQIPISLINMSNIYQKQQNFMQFLNSCDNYHLINAFSIKGTDCYCDDLALEQLNKLLAEVLAYGIHFIDGGNYHYLSKIFTDKLQQQFDLVVFDHHHDMQQPLFGAILSCGGWIKEVLENNTFLNRVVIIGVQDELITQELQIQYSQVQFITENMILSMVDKLLKEFDKNDNLLNEKVAKCIFDKLNIQCPVYISIDKDVLSKEQYMTNWDQGILSVECLKILLSFILNNNQVVGIDICGEMDVAMQEQYGNQWNKVNGEVNVDLLKIVLSIEGGNSCGK